jgi:N-acetylglutamate synthase-like GNAT family acetyltransferase
LRFRIARKSDRDDIVSFCNDTFSWGDYIAQVLDLWYTDLNGTLFVADLGREKKIQNRKGKKIDKNESNSVIAVSHVAVCSNKKLIWLEGIRVHPTYRRNKIATHLIRKMLLYGKKQGAKEASAIVTTNNIASQCMLKKNGFEVTSKWTYYNVNYEINHTKRMMNVKIASSKDIDEIWNYLVNSEIYKLSGRRYVSTWRLYYLDHTSLERLIEEKRLIMIYDPLVSGIAIINNNGYWNRDDVLQICYLDSPSEVRLQNLISFIISSFVTPNKKSSSSSHSKQFHQLEILAYHTEGLSWVMKKKFNVEESEQFLLHTRDI